MRDIKGAIHVHSRYSDGSGSVEEIVAAAAKAGLDYCILTDHDTLKAADDGFGGRYGKMLLVVAAEVSPFRRGHCLAVSCRDVKGYRWMPEKFFLRKLRRDGADTYIAHPGGQVKPTFGINLRQWHAWQEEQFTGIEIWSYMHDWVKNVSPLTLPKYYLHPEQAIDGPEGRVLGLWDRLNIHRRVVGIGALDAHAVKMFFGLLVAFEYEFLFRTILTHVLVDEWGNDQEADTAELARSLREGRAYVSYEADAPAEGFDFRAGDDVVMGARVRFRDEMTLRVTLPQTAEIRLIHNGRLTADCIGAGAEFKAAGPGVYRVEVRLRERPWIFSNPIFLGTAGE